MFVDLCLHRTVDGVIVGGVRDVRRHMDGVSHLKAERARENTKGGVGQYIVACEAKATQVIRAETLWAHFIAEKNLPFAICDVFTRMASHMFPDSEIAKAFSAGRTKVMHILKGCLAAHQDDKVTKLCQTQV